VPDLLQTQDDRQLLALLGRTRSKTGQGRFRVRS
jgi:hypothetical protein